MQLVTAAVEAFVLVEARARDGMRSRARIHRKRAHPDSNHHGTGLQGTAHLGDARQGHAHRIVTADPLDRDHLGGVLAPETDVNADHVLYHSNAVHLHDAWQRDLWSVLEYA